MSHNIEVWSATEAFQKAYKAVQNCGERVNSRLGTTKHLTNVTITLKDPHRGICFDKARNLSLKYMLGEIQWYMSGSNKVADIGKYAKMWYDLTDDGETVNSAYGYRIFHKFGFDQLQYYIDKLKTSTYDRQAVIHIKEADNKPTKDTPCTCLLQFTCYLGKLNLHTYMRSNDVWLGLPYDIVFFVSLLQIVAKAVDLPIGEYCHTVGDLHLYEKHWDKPVGESDKGAYWDCFYSDISEKDIKSALTGKAPDHPVLRRLWEMNNEKKSV